jgi:hypothetical protein
MDNARFAEAATKRRGGTVDAVNCAGIAILTAARESWLAQERANTQVYLEGAYAFRMERDDLAAKQSHVLADNERLHVALRECETRLAQEREAFLNTKALLTGEIEAFAVREGELRSRRPLERLPEDKFGPADEELYQNTAEMDLESLRSHYVSAMMNWNITLDVRDDLKDQLSTALAENRALREAAVMFAGQGHRSWCKLDGNGHLMRAECSCGLVQLENVLDAQPPTPTDPEDAR